MKVELEIRHLVYVFALTLGHCKNNWKISSVLFGHSFGLRIMPVRGACVESMQYGGHIGHSRAVHTFHIFE